MPAVTINGSEVEAEVLDMANGVLQIAFTGGQTFDEVDELLGTSCNVEAEGKTFEDMRVQTIARLSATELDRWKGKRVTAVLRESER